MKVIPPRKNKSTPAQEVDFEIPAGMKLHKIGNIIRNGGKTYRCIKVSPSNAVFQNTRNAGDIEHFSNCHDKTLEILSSDDGEETNINQNNENTDMAKKTTTKETNGKPGKIEFIESLLDGKLTKAEIAAKVIKEYGIEEKTAKNTVNWTCSTYGTRNAGKVAKYKEVERAAKSDKKPVAKKSSAKKPAAKKSPPKRKTAASAKPATTGPVSETAPAVA